jgi:tellurite resistance protein TehA-like permease
MPLENLHSSAQRKHLAVNRRTPLITVVCFISEMPKYNENIRNFVVYMLVLWYIANRLCSSCTMCAQYSYPFSQTSAAKANEMTLH